MDAEKIGKQIAALRKERGFTQEGLAETLGISPQAVSKWENGRALYAEVSAAGLDSGEYLEGERARGFWTKEKRVKQAELLREMLETEREAAEIAGSF
jgi:transcriptional regulator with XRE-family HTH domain